MEKIDYAPWVVVRQIGAGTFGKVYEIARKDFGDHIYRAALKVLSIPQNEDEVRYELANGHSQRTIAEYYRSCVNQLTNEIKILSEMKGHTNIVSYEDHKIVPHHDGIGADIYIRMELLTSLQTYLSKKTLSRNQIIRLGMDICRALELCERKHIIHRDIKPGNIFISEDGDFKLGDFGISRSISRTLSTLSVKGTPRYMAPEILRQQAYGVSADVYSLGIVLYQLLNNGKFPFVHELTSVAEEERAFQRRMKGEALPVPENCDDELAKVVLKACAYEPEKRYFSAKEMLQDLQKLDYSEENIDMTDFAPEPLDMRIFDDDATDLFGWTEQDSPRHGTTGRRSSSSGQFPPKESKASKTTRWPLIMVLCLIALVLAGAVCIVARKGGSTSDTEAVYGLYNSDTGEYFYTADADERKSLVGKGWENQGVAWYTPDPQKSKGIPVYRLSNSSGREHIYTTSKNEVDTLREAGWKREGICWYSDEKPYDDTNVLKPSDATHYPYKNAIPVYRLYDSKNFSNNHRYTTSKSERKKLIKEGWQAEGVAWYCMAKGKMTGK